MATYLQGVTDYIPQFQPFQPDLNFYNNVLQTKQSQYDSNYKALNNAYGEYFYADLTRDNNIEKKDELLKNIDFNLKRVSGLDLSLEQNVTQAMQVFKPFYEDKYLMKDMAWTKNFKASRDEADFLKNSKDEKERARWWETGIKDMEYRRLEFKDLSDDESLSFGNVEYTSYKNPIQTLMKAAKDAGIQSMDVQRWSDDGTMIITEKGGKQMLPQLNSLFETVIQNDPELAAVYKTQAYVNRKDYTYNLADSKFQGNKDLAEKEYLNLQYSTISKYAALKNKKSQQENEVVKNIESSTEEDIKTNNDNINSLSFLERIKKAREVSEANANHAEETDKQVNGGTSSTTVTQGGVSDDDIDALRRKVDIGTAAMFMDQDAAQAAYQYAFKDYKFSMEYDPLYLENKKHQFRASELNMASDNRIKELAIKNQYDSFQKGVQWKIDNGILQPGKNGELEPTHKYDTPTLVKGFYSSSGVTNPVDLEKENKSASNEFATSYASDFIYKLANYYKNEVKIGHMTEAMALSKLNTSLGPINPKTGLQEKETTNLFSKQNNNSWMGSMYEAGNKIAQPKKFKSIDAFISDYTANPGAYLEGNGSSRVAQIQSNWDDYAERWSGYKNVVKMQQDPNFEKAYYDMNIYNAFVKGKEQVDVKNKTFMKTQLKGTGVDDKMVDIFLNLDGSAVDKEVFMTRVKRNITPPTTKFLKITSPLNPINNKNIKTNLSKSELNGLEQAIKKEILYNDTRIKHKYDTKSEEIYAKYKSGAYNTLPDWDKNFLQQKVSKVTNDYLKKINNPADYAADIYENLSRKHKSAYQSGQWSTYGTISKVSNASKVGVYATDGSSWQVNPKLMNEGSKGFMETTNDILSNINFYDTENTGVSFGRSAEGLTTNGATLSALEYGKENNLNAKAIMILQDIKSHFGDPKTKMQDIRIVTGQIGAEDRDKGVMTIYPDNSTIQKYVKGKVITEQEGADLLQNGMTFVAPRNQWTNSLYTQNKIKPLEGIVKALGKYEWKDPSGAGTIHIEKNDIPGMPYVFNYQLNTYDVKSNTWKKGDANYVSNTNFGNNLENAFLSAQQIISNWGMQENEKYQQSKEK